MCKWVLCRGQNPIQRPTSVICVFRSWKQVLLFIATVFFFFLKIEYERRGHVEHGSRLWRWRSLRAGRSPPVWWQRVVPADDAVTYARLPQCSLHLRECLAAPIPFGTLGPIYRRLPAALVRHSNRTRPRLLVRTLCPRHGAVLSHHVPTGHFDGHHHPPASFCRSGQSLGAASQIGTSATAAATAPPRELTTVHLLFV